MFRLVFGLAALACAVSFALMPLEQQTIDYVWNPETDGTGVPLMLIERVPDSFDLSFPCAVANDSDGLLFTSSRSLEGVPALAVEAVSRRIVVEFSTKNGGERSTLELELESKVAPDCAVSVTYDRAASELLVEAEGSIATLDEASFEVTGLHWFADTQSVYATVRTVPSSAVRNSIAQKSVIGLLAALALVAAWQPALNWARRSLRSGWWRLRLSEWAMIGVVVFVALVDLPRVDDGRILSRARLLAGPELLANVSTVYENRPVPQRWLYEWILGTTVGWSNVIVVMRSLSIVAGVVAWILFRRKILPKLVQGSPSGAVVIGAWSVHALFTAAWLATLRPEPVLVALFAGVLALMATWPRHPRAWPYTLGLVFIGLSVATHVLGILSLISAIPVIVWARRDISRDPIRVTSGIVWGLTFAIIFGFIGSNIRHSISALIDFRDADLHSLGLLDSTRYVELTIETTSVTMRASMMLFGIAAVALLAQTATLDDWRFSSRRTAIIFGTAIAPFGLLLAPSKWVWHLAILAPIAVVGWAVIVDYYESRHGRNPTPIILFSTVIGLGIAWSVIPAWDARTLGRWSGVGLRNISQEVWSSRVPWLVGVEVRWWLWISIALAVCVGVTCVYRRVAHSQGMGPAIASLLALSVAVTAPVQLLPPVADAWVAGEEWTFVRQSVVGTVLPEVACGAPLATPSVREHLVGESDARASANGTLSGNSRGALLAPCHTMIGQRLGVWQEPDLIIGGSDAGLNRLRTEYDISSIGCNSFPRSRSGDLLCFAAVDAPGTTTPLEPSDVQWGTARGG